MSKKEIAKIQKMLRGMGLNEKQIKIIIKRAEKAKLSAADVADAFVLVWAFGVVFAFAEMAGLFKNINVVDRVIKLLKKYQN